MQRGSGRAGGCRRTARLLLAAGIALAMLAAPGLACAAEPAGGAYNAVITGVQQPDLQALLVSASQLISNRETPPATFRQLRRRADKDVERLGDVLRSRGYYGHAIEYAIDAGRSPALVTVTVATGAVYRLTDYRIVARGAMPATPISIPYDDLGVSLGMPAEGKPVRAAEIALVAHLNDLGYPFAVVADRRNLVNHTDRSLTVTTAVEVGPLAAFGETQVVGLEDVVESVVRGRLAWQPGDRYDPGKVAETRRDLLKTQLFSSIDIEHADAVDASGRLAMVITLGEREPRSVGAGVGFATDDGFQARAFWEHRNLFGEAEKLRSTLRISEIAGSLNTQLTIPWFLSPKQDLLINNSIERERTDAFDRDGIGAGISLQRDFTDRWSGAAGGAFEWERVTEDDVTRVFRLVSLPANLTYDSSNDTLDPTRGARLSLSVTPYAKALGSDLNFVRLQLTESVYWPIIGDNDLVVAARYRLGTILGEEVNDLPASKRFFAGGGGSVRGYAFQSIGPRGSDNEPSGGRSVLELGLELRLRITDEIGIVPFIEGGEVFEDTLPDLGGSPQWGAGLGVRYFTPVGPLRLDVAVPINRRRDIDDAFQFYISLGQAF